MPDETINVRLNILRDRYNRYTCTKIAMRARSNTVGLVEYDT